MRLVTSLLLLFVFTLTFAQPSDDLLDEKTLRRVGEAARIAGEAQVCGLNWQPFYLTFMQVERQGDWTQLQLAFMGAYFGAMQALEKDQPCDVQRRALVQGRLDTGLAALRTQLVEARYYPADKFVFEPRVQLPEGSCTRSTCDQIIRYEFEVSALGSRADSACYMLQTTPEEATAYFRSNLIILGYKLIEEGQGEVPFTLWKQRGTSGGLLLGAASSENGAYLVAHNTSN